MAQISIRFSGFGGQGLVLSAIIIACGAVIHDEKEAVQTQIYGPESRGGASKAEVIVSDREIDYPLIEKSDVLVALSQEALDKYFPDVRENSLVIIDPAFIKDIPEASHVHLIEIPAAELADELGSRLVANMIILGALVTMSSVISKEALEKSIKDNTAKPFHKLNTTGMSAGMKYAEEIRGKKN